MDNVRASDAYLHGADGLVTTVPAWYARELFRDAEINRRLGALCVGQPAFAEVTIALRRAGFEVGSASGSVAVPNVEASQQMQQDSTRWMSVRDAAELLVLEPRSVVKRIKKQQLAAWRPEGTRDWKIDPNDHVIRAARRAAEERT